jgi:hypothetical protein
LGPLRVHGHPWGPLPRQLYFGKARRSLDPGAPAAVAGQRNFFDE